MKNFFRSILACVAGSYLLAAAPAQAQTFPNSTLDTWATRKGIEAPTNWQTTDDEIEAAVGMRIPSGTVTKTTVVHGGTFAAELQTQKLLGQFDVPGQILLGTSLSGGGSADLPGGLPFTARPTALQFYYQLIGPQALADSAIMEVQLTRRVNGKTQVVAAGAYLFKALSASYALVSVPLQYQSTTLVPDSVKLGFSSGSGTSITVGTILRIDDILFTGSITATRDAALAAAISVFPNPSPDGRYQLGSTEPALLAAPITVLDATGRVVRREAAPAQQPPAPTRTLDLSDLPGGIYTVQLLTPHGLVTRKVSR